MSAAFAKQMHNNSAERKPRLERIYVTLCGALKALYDDNTVLVLSSAAETFTHVSPTGGKTAQLCDCCLSRFTPLLNEMLDFRNQHVDTPMFCRCFKQQLSCKGQLHQLGYPITDVDWPATPEEAFARDLAELPDKCRVIVHSRCGSAHLVLEYTGLRFAVTYPILVDSDPSTSTYTYTTQTQVFSRSQYPSRWQPALAVASAVADNAAQGFRLQQLQQVQDYLQHIYKHCRTTSTQQRHQGLQQQLSDVTNLHAQLAQQSSTPMCVSSPNQNRVQAGSSPKRYGSPIQRQHKFWRQQQKQLQNGSTNSRPGTSGSLSQVHVWRTHQQHQQQRPQSPTATAATGVKQPFNMRYGSPLKGESKSLQADHSCAARSTIDSWETKRSVATAVLFSSPPLASGIAAATEQTNSCYQHSLQLCISQLPIADDLLQRLQSHGRQWQQHGLQQQQQKQQHLALPLAAARQPQQQQQLLVPLQPSSSSRAGIAGSQHNSRIATALAEALGQQKVHSIGAAAAAACDGSNWWLEPSLQLPSSELIQLVWTREATMVFVQDVEEVEVWLHADDSCMFSFQSGAFITHLLPTTAAAGWEGGETVPTTCATAAAAVGTNGFASDAAAADIGCDRTGLVEGVIDASNMSRVYAASALPHLAATAVSSVAQGWQGGAAAAAAGVQVPVGQIASQALKFRSAMVRVKRCLAAAAAAAVEWQQPTRSAFAGDISAPLGALNLPTSTFAAFRQQYGASLSTSAVQYQQQLQGQQQQWSADVIEQQDVPGCGQFAATADGRVRIVFADRTLLYLAADRSSCSVMLPDGTRRVVATSNPLGVEEYVLAALEFATWSSTSPEQRGAALRMQALVAAELRSSIRMAAICEWGSAQQLPAAAAGSVHPLTGTTLADQQTLSGTDDNSTAAANTPAMQVPLLLVSPAGPEQCFDTTAATAPGTRMSGIGHVSQTRTCVLGSASPDSSSIAMPRALMDNATARHMAVQELLAKNAFLLERLTI